MILVIRMQMKAVFHFPGIAIILFVVSNRRIKENDNLSPLLSYSASLPQKTPSPELSRYTATFISFRGNG